jgi:hypothetical protein
VRQIFGGLTRADVELTTELISDELRAAHVTGRPHAHLDNALPPRLEGQGSIEARYPVDLRHGQTELVCHVPQVLLTNPVELILNVLKDRDKRGLLSAMPIDDPVDVHRAHVCLLALIRDLSVLLDPFGLCGANVLEP